MAAELQAQIFAAFIVFARVGAMMMTLPALGELNIPARVRLLLAIAISALIAAALGPALPPLPADPASLAGLIGVEVLIGVFLGFSVRILLSAVQTAGAIIAMQTGLGFAMSIDPGQQTQAAIVTTFLTLLAVTLIFMADLHHLMIAGMLNSYTLFAPGVAPDAGAMAQSLTSLAGQAFAIGVQLSAPFLVFGLLFHAGVGLVSKLMPQVQIFFVAMPASILLGFALLLLSLSAIMMTFLDGFGAGVQRILG